MAFSLVDISSVKSTSILSQVDLNSSRIFSQGPQYLVGIWNTTIRNPETLEIQTFWMWDFKWSGFSCSYIYSPNYLKTGKFKIWTFLSGFQMVFDKMVVICLDFKWLGFQIPSKIQTICNPTFFHYLRSRFVWISDPHCSVLCYSKGGYLNCLFGSTECVRVGGQMLAKMALCNL